MDLFGDEFGENVKDRKLADRMRPETLDEYFGQEHIVGPNKPLRNAIETDRVSSILLFGPPGCGKTTLAHIIAQQTKGIFVRLNAVDASVKDVRQVINEAKNEKNLFNRQTILFLDEVHRFNKARQDIILPDVERGTITFIGATTENPFHAINGALLSRTTLFSLKPLTKKHSLLAMHRALHDEKKGLGGMNLQVEEEALEHIAAIANGDIRRALNALEFAVLTTSSQKDGTIKITLEIAEQAVRTPAILTDESTQYDVLSAFHKSVRGSSDAALFWFLYAVEKLGMDPAVFIRRLVVACSEDIGLANPQAMVQAVTAWQGYERIGWPEARYLVTQAILFAVESPKSNSVSTAIQRVMTTLDRELSADVPLHLRDSHYQGAKKLGHDGYKYPHDFPGHFIEQQYLPKGLTSSVFYEASDQGTEEKILQKQKKRRNTHIDE